MKLIKFLLLGVIFGITLTKAEIISWFRIQEMFRFESFHMYGVIGSAVMLGILMVWLSKKYGWKSIEGHSFNYSVQDAGWRRFLFGGIIFGLGWAMTGACPGPLFILVGNGYGVFLFAIGSAILGTFFYGLLRKYLPH